MRIGVLGSGTVGTTLAGGFLAHGHEVMIGSREPAKHGRSCDDPRRRGRPSRGQARDRFICGNDQPAKALVTRLLDQFGWDTEDMGEVEAARAIEPLCILWCIPGLRQNQWTHAFRLLK